MKGGYPNTVVLGHIKQALEDLLAGGIDAKGARLLGALPFLFLCSDLSSVNRRRVRGDDSERVGTAERALFLMRIQVSDQQAWRPDAMSGLHAYLTTMAHITLAA
jgi:hypothetical protein